jgi:hypothetical protein
MFERAIVQEPEEMVGVSEPALCLTALTRAFFLGDLGGGWLGLGGGGADIAAIYSLIFAVNN